MDTSPTPVVLAQQAIPIPQYQRGSSNMVKRLVWHPNGQEFAVIDSDWHVLIFNAITKRLVRKLPRLKSIRPNSSYPVVAYSPDGRYLAAGKDVIHIYAADTGEKVRDIEGPYLDQHEPHAGGIKSLAFSPDSQMLAVAYIKFWSLEKESNDVLASYEIATGKRIFATSLPPFHSRSTISTNIVYTPDGKYLLAGRSSLLPYSERVKTGEPSQYFTFIDYWDSQTGKLIQSITPVHVMAPTALAISPDGRYVASGTDTGSVSSSRRPRIDKWDVINNQDPVKLWDITTRQLVREYPVHNSVRALAISPDGRYLAVHHNLEVALFDFVSGQRLQTVKLPGRPGFTLSLQLGFSPDSKSLAVPLDKHVFLLTLK